MTKNLQYYRGLPYTLDVERFVEEADGETYFRAVYRELPNVKGIHRDRLLAISLAKELFDAYVEAQLEWGEEVPEPEAVRYRKPGGLFKFVQPGVRSGAARLSSSVEHTRDHQGESGSTGGFADSDLKLATQT